VAPPAPRDPIAEVEWQAKQALGQTAEPYDHLAADSRQALPQAGEITFVPTVPGIEFNPPSRTFRWRKRSIARSSDCGPWPTRAAQPPAAPCAPTSGGPHRGGVALHSHGRAAVARERA